MTDPFHHPRRPTLAGTNHPGLLLLLWLCCCFLLPLPALAASPLVINTQDLACSIGRQADILEDPTREWSIDDITVGGLGTFVPSTADSPNLGFTSSAYWLRFSLKNELPQANAFFIEVGYPLLDHIDLYEPVASGGFVAIRAGDHLPFGARAINFRNVIFPLHISPGETKTFYVRCETTSSMTLPLTLLTPYTLTDRINSEQTMLGIYYGILFVMLFYNLFLFANVRDITYLYYVLFISSFLLFQLTLNGASFQYFWPNQLWWANICLPFFIFMAYLFGTRFTRFVLNTREYAPLLDRLLRYTERITFIGLFLPFFTSYAISIKLATFWVMTVFLLIISGFWCAAKGYRPARYYFLAWSFSILGITVYAMRSFGLLPHNFITSWGIQLGSAWEVVLLSLGLADRFRLLEQEALKQKYARESLESTNQAKSAFLAAMSHEIRTPMNAVIGMTDLALNLPTTSQLKGYLTTIRTSAHSLLSIINDILDFSKIEAGRLELEAISFNLDKEIELLANLFSKDIADKQLELLIDVAEDVPVALIGDPLRLRQVLFNLIGNAIKFTARGEITLRVTCQASDPADAELHFSVSDTGIGISETQQQKLFTPFTQADTSTSRKYGGTGLGLAISKRIVERMHGSISLTSNPGAGSTFSFSARFPLQLAAEPLQPATLPEELHSSGVILADANISSRQLLTAMIKNLGLTVNPFASWREAAKHLTTSPPSPDRQIVLLSFTPEDQTCFTSLKRINNLPESVDIALIIAVDSLHEKKFRTTGQQADFTLLSKPVTRTKLLQALLETASLTTTAAAPEPPAEEGLPARPASYFQGAHVLLVEDNHINQQVTQEILQLSGVIVDIVESGQAAIDAVDRQRYDAVLMDVQMPEMDGLEATSLIRQNQRHLGLPIIAMTAHAMEGDREECLTAGMDDYLTKPFHPEELLAKLGKYITPSQPPAAALPLASVTRASFVPDNLPGLQVAEALKRLGGNHKLLAKLISEFCQDYADSVTTIISALEQQQPGVAQRQAHTIKGLAGTFGAATLQQRAEELEKTIMQDNFSDLPQLIGDFEIALIEALSSLKTLQRFLLQSEKNSTVTAAAAQRDRQPPSLYDLQSKLTAFKHHLDSNNVKALECLNELKSMLADLPAAAMMEQVEAQLSRYNFKAAQNLYPELIRMVEEGR